MTAAPDSSPRNADGTPRHATTSPNITGIGANITGGLPNRTGGSSAHVGADRTRVEAKPTTSSQSQERMDAQWASVTEIPGFKAERGDAERLSGHGVQAGIVNGVLVIARKDMPRATQLLGG
jgi:hypothetical protein